jgi:hypothetical protein
VIDGFASTTAGPVLSGSPLFLFHQENKMIDPQTISDLQRAKEKLKVAQMNGLDPAKGLSAPLAAYLLAMDEALQMTMTAVILSSNNCDNGA